MEPSFYQVIVNIAFFIAMFPSILSLKVKCEKTSFPNIYLHRYTLSFLKLNSNVQRLSS